MSSLLCDFFHSINKHVVRERARERLEVDETKHNVERLGYVCNPRSLKEGTETSRRMTDELGSRQRDLSTSSVTKRANGHWHAIIASSCR